MGLNQITLKNYDTVVAVTQASINETLAEFLNKLQKHVALYYDVDNNGNFVPAPPASADYLFTGTLDYTLDPKGNPVNMVELYSGKGPQTVRYNITFSKAEFKSTILPKFDITQQPGSNPWVISFLVDLSHVAVSLSSLPKSTQAAVQAATSGLPPNTFSIQQLYIDLNTAQWDSFTNISGMSTFAGTIFTGILRSYLASLQSSGGIIFGYAVHSLPANPTPPTFMPTALDFCVSPYTDGSGNHSDPSLDTLCYLTMTGNRPLPPNVPDGFTFNWVDDHSLQGAMAIRSQLYLGFLLEQLSPVLQSISKVAYVKADANKSPTDQTMELNAGPAGAFTVVYPPKSGVIATFAYSSAPASDTQQVFGGSQDVSLTYSSSCNVTAGGPTVTIAGNAIVSAESDANSMGNVSSYIMPLTTYVWSVQLLLQMDPGNNGQLDYSIQNPNFDSAPTVAPQDQSAWQQFLAAVGGGFRVFVDDPGDIRETLNSQVLNNIQPALAATIKAANHFVFPGAATFLFKNPGFSATDDLAANITYVTPYRKSASERAAGV